MDKAIESWNAMAIKASRAGIPIYSHSHQIPWSFLLDSGPRDAKGFTRSSGIRVMDYFLKHTDAKWVKCEFDLFWAHVAQHQFHSYTAADGSTVEAVFDPAKQVASDPSRYVILHAKDGIRAPKTPEGYVICPFGYGDLDVARFVRESKLGQRGRVVVQRAGQRGRRRHRSAEGAARHRERLPRTRDGGPAGRRGRAVHGCTEGARLSDAPSGYFITYPCVERRLPVIS